jgi:hypothetical protein
MGHRPILAIQLVAYEVGAWIAKGDMVHGLQVVLLQDPLNGAWKVISWTDSQPKIRREHDKSLATHPQYCVGP